MEIRENCEVDFDHHSPEFVERKEEILDELRSACPVAHSSNYGGFWVATSHKAVAEVARNHESFSSDNDPDNERNGYGGNTVPPAPQNFGLVHTDPPRWNQIRRIYNPLFSPPAVESMLPMIRDVSAACIDKVIEKGEGDLIADVASPIPAIVICLILDVPLDRWPLYARAIHRMNKSTPGTPEGDRAAVEVAEMTEDVRKIVAQRDADGAAGDDVISKILRAEVDGRRMTVDEALLETMLLINGGTDTTSALLGNSLLWLSEHPEEAQALRDDPEKVALATEEFLRVFAPVTGMARTCSRDYDLLGHQIREGEPVLMSFVGANHDPEVFEDPHEVITDRWPNRHTSFGLGIHRCTGSNLARTMAHTVIMDVLNRMPDLKIDREKANPYPDFGTNQGWDSLPMTFTPGPKVGSSIQL